MKVCLSPKPVQSTKTMLLGNVNYTQSEVLKSIDDNKNFDKVINSSAVDMFLVGLDNKSVFKIDSNFLYAVNEEEQFNFIMIPKSENTVVSNIINFIITVGIGSIIEVPIVKNKKRYTTDLIKSNIEKVVDFSGYVKHILNEDSVYPLAEVHNLPFNTNVISKGDFYVLQLPTKILKLSEHLDIYASVYGKNIKPISRSKQGYYEYSDTDLAFINRLVLQYNFEPRRIAEVFVMPTEGFVRGLIERYRYKVGNIDSMSYNDSNHDLKGSINCCSKDTGYTNDRLCNKKVA